MSRYAYGGKTTVESCQSIDVLHWNRLGYFRYSPWFSWVRTRDGERLASVEIRHHSVILKYRSRPYSEDWSDVEQWVIIAWTPCRFGGERPWFVCSAESNGRGLRPPGYQAVQRWRPVRVPPLPSACV